ncbi:MAG: hypothetical protein ACMG6H_03575 [Acidobacteriota bacterium]
MEVDLSDEKIYMVLIFVGLEGIGKNPTEDYSSPIEIDRQMIVLSLARESDFFRLEGRANYEAGSERHDAANHAHPGIFILTVHVVRPAA